MHVVRDAQAGPHPIAIFDIDDPRIAPYRQVREKDLVGREGLFIAEGAVVLPHLARSPTCEAVSVLIADSRIEALGSLLGQFDPQVPVYCASQAVMDEIVGFPIHRGILGLGRRTEEVSLTRLASNLGARALVLVLVGISNHDNMGGLFRNAAAFGADAVILDATCCDPLYRKAIRVSAGACLDLPYVRLAPEADLLGVLCEHGFSPVALSPSGKVALSETARPGRAAVLLGPEGPGLPDHLLDRSMTVRIPMAQGFDSLNVAVAGALALHHMAFVAKAKE